VSALRVAEAAAELWRYVPGQFITRYGIRSVDVVVTRLVRRDGLEGMGFGLAWDGRDELPLAAARQLLERFVVGQKLAHPLALARRILGSFGRTGDAPYRAALAAIDVAAWDLYAKTLGVPLGVALGGEMRRVRVYASGDFLPDGDADRAVELAKRARERGARAIKLRAAGTPQDAAVFRAVAGAVGGELEILIDCNQRCTLSTARRVLRFAAEIGARFVEEPLPVTQPAGYQALAHNAPVAIATGENLRGSVEAAAYLLGHWCSVIQPDLSAMGGLSECLRTAQLAEHCNIEVAPHFLPGFFIHLAAAAPHLTWLEDWPTVEGLFANMPVMESDGMISPPTATGHGLAFADGAREMFRIA
jgi:L-alanine-DL-glutamate epimerase-like enolase superfamily enzyme